MPGVDIDVAHIDQIGRANNATEIRLAGSDEERAALWKGRKTAFGAVAQIAPDYYLHDTVVPRAKLADVLEQVYEIVDRPRGPRPSTCSTPAMGTCTLSSSLTHARKAPSNGSMRLAQRSFAHRSKPVACCRVSTALASRSSSTWRNCSGKPISITRTDSGRHSTRPAGANPGKVLPAGHSCADIQALRDVPTGVWG